MRCFSHILFLAGLLGAGVGLGAEAPAEERSELKEKLDQAREEVDRAVSKLADLLQEKMEQAPEGGFTAWLGRALGAELGVAISPLDEEGGVLLEGVSPGSGAEQAGLKAGDRLVMIDDVRLDEPGGRAALLEHMKNVNPDQEVTLWVLRDGETERVTVVAQSRTTEIRSLWDGIDLDFDLDVDGVEAMGRRFEAASVPRLVDVDADLGAYFGVDEGVLVLNAPENTELRSGDVLLSLDGEAVTSARQARRTLSDVEEPVAAQIMRQKSKLSLSIAPGAFPRHIGKRIRIIKLEEDELP